MKSFYKSSLPALIFFSLTFCAFNSFSQTTLIPFGSSWKYLDTDIRPMNWETSGFLDGGWSNGNGQLGYGDGDETTIVACAACSAKYITTYFRKTINIPDPSIYSSFTLNVKRDDGVVVYLNGTEIAADNMPAGRLHSTLASSGISGAGESTPISFAIASGSFSSVNVIAVEIHQNATNSSDISFDLELLGNLPTPTTLTRGPYLQMGNQTGITIRWRTAAAINSRVTWGTSFGTYPNVIDDATNTTEHIVRITGLSADTKYFYTIGSSTQTFQATNTNYVVTAPASGSDRKFRILALGDCGNASANQVDAKNSFLNYIGSNEVDAIITLGDNAYSSGLDNEFQAEFFDIYKDDILKYNKLYPTPGNHDYGNTQANSGVRNNAYYNNFSLPTAAECGGVASGTEAYYSFDIGNIHFLSLDSYGREDANTTRIYDTTGAQATWIKADLTANTKRWVVAYFHHPPYTKTSHTSDTEQELIDIREKFVRILERYGVDLILSGHAHGYERSYLLKGFYKATPANPTLVDSDFRKLLHTTDSSSAKYNGTALSCAYKYNSGQYNHGSIYLVSGSAGQLGGTTLGYPQDCMYYSNVTNGGVLYFETDSNRLDAKFISYTAPGNPTPVVRDQFTIFKDVNKVTDINVTVNDVLNINASWRGNYYWPGNGGATTQSIVVNTSSPGTFNFKVLDASVNSCLKDSFHIVVSGTLPILLSTFSATLNYNKVLLDWSTVQEQNNKYFTMEKSVDGRNYNYLERVNGAGNSTNINYYHLIDNAPFDGVNYYRLSQTNFDNKVTYYEQKKIIYRSSNHINVSIQNVEKNKINIIINSNKSQRVQLKIIDMLGNQITDQALIISLGTNNKILKLTEGAYVLTVTDTNGQRITNKLIVQ
ncbi:MAG: metallophosphoesterase [Ferruginibacter sp.]